MEILVILIVGGVAGWLGSTIYKGSGSGILGNIIVGIIGSVVVFNGCSIPYTPFYRCLNKRKSLG